MKLKVIIFLLTITILQIDAMSDVAIKKYMKNYAESKMKLQVSQIDIVSSYPLKDAPGWKVHFLSMRVKVKIAESFQTATINKTVFTNGKRITVKLMKKGRIKRDGTRKKSVSYSKILKPIVPMDAYDDEHFLAGDKNAPHKLLLFSDPFCPYCAEKLPEILKVIKDNPHTYALYYYHLPLLKIHPASDVTTRAMHLFHKKGDIKNMVALYDLFLEAQETNIKEILRAIRVKTGVVFTKKQLFTSEIDNAMRIDMAMKRRLQVTGTPTIFIDGKWDKSRKEYKKYAK
jgi:hypothetical protein